MLEIRPAEEADLEAEHQVFVTAEGELWRRHGFDWPAPSFEAWAPVQQHLLREDGERAFVAVDAGTIVAFTAAIARSDTWYFSALFVLPTHQGRGIGRELLECAWSGSFARRITITDSFQPVSSGLYGGRGLIPITPILSLSGIPASVGAPKLEAGPVDQAALRVLDSIAYGFDRTVDHRHWVEQKGSPTVWSRAGEAVGYAYIAPSGLIGPLVASEPDAAADVLRAELARRSAEVSTVLIPGTCRTLVAAALDAGLRFIRPPGLLLLSDGTQAPSSLAISGYWLL